VRNAGLPQDFPNDVAFGTAATGIDLARIPIPCRAERYTARRGPDTWWPTPEPPHRINQIYLDPVLFSHAAGMTGLRLLSRTRVAAFTQSETGVTASAEDLVTGKIHELSAQYLVGGDGAHSEVRHRVGAVMSGDPVVINTQSAYIRAPRLLAMMQKPAWCISVLNSRYNA
jgi:2-polyprenyl-6-methoxyphenol hydroxylase-like FAD-dependent oxidoreductase